MNSVISINNITKTYEGPPPVKALDGVTLEVQKGDFVAIVGQSGSGKSTLLNMIGLLDSVTEGTIDIEGKNISELSDNELSKFRGEKIGFIFQSFFLLPGLTAQENVAEGLLYQGISRTERLESATKDVGVDILIGENTAKNCKLVLKSLESIKVKGKKDELPIWTL